MKLQIRTKVALVLALVCVAATPAWGASQLDAADEPTVTGEQLELQSDDCRRQEEKDDDTGAVIARGKTCLWVYGYDPADETDAERNYGVVWLQSTVNSRGGWCASRVLSDVDLPEAVEVESRAPSSMDLKRRKTYDTVLTTDAAGNGSGEASIEQTQILYPERIRVRVVPDSNVFRLKWVGLRSDKLGFASGAEVSWPVDEQPRITFRLNYELKRGDC